MSGRLKLLMVLTYICGYKTPEDLKAATYDAKRIKKHLTVLRAEMYPLKEWNTALGFLTEEDDEDTEEKARAKLLDYYDSLIPKNKLEDCYDYSYG